MRSCLRKQRNKWGGAWVTFIDYQVHASECHKDSFWFLRQGLYTALANLELTNHRDPPASTSWVMELKACAVTTPGCAKNHPCIFVLRILLCKLGWPRIPDLSACVHWKCRLVLSHLPGFPFKSSPKISSLLLFLFYNEETESCLLPLCVCAPAKRRS